MLPEIDHVLLARGGVATRAHLLAAVSRGQLDHETRSGQLVSPFRRTWCRPWDADQRDVRHRAALLSVGPPAALSHLTALARAGLHECPADEPVHVTVPGSRYLRGQPGLRLHRVAVVPRVAVGRGLRTVTRADAIVSSWPLLTQFERRAPAITAVRDRALSPASLTDALQRHPRLAKVGELQHLIALLVAGCESELEIWGHLGVFDHAGLRHGVRQRRVAVGAERYRLDLSYDVERVDVEMDGERWHSTREQRERDRRRDAKLASIGWLTLRFSHERMHDDSAGCRADTLATLAARRTTRRAG